MISWYISLIYHEKDLLRVDLHRQDNLLFEINRSEGKFDVEIAGIAKQPRYNVLQGGVDVRKVKSVRRGA